MFLLTNCKSYVECPCVCDDVGEPKGQCANCGAKWFEHDLSVLPDSEKESAKKIQNEKFLELSKKAWKDLKENGYVGMDYNMAVICICAKRTGTKINFGHGGGNYDSKIEYWSSKRVFCHLHVSSENDMLNHAIKEYKIS